MGTRAHIIHVRVDGIRQLSTGGIAVDACLSKTGVLEYRDPSGAVIREFRTPAAVTDPDAVESLIGATVTVHHPASQRVTSENYRTHVVGTVARAWVDGENIMGELHIHDEETIAAIMNRELIDLSPGYGVTLSPTPGVDSVHGAYDVTTESMRYNHIALLPPGQGRQGPEVSLRLDSADNVIIDYEQSQRRNDMDPEELKKIVADMLPDQEEMMTGVAEKLASTLPDMIKALIAEAMAGAKSETDEEDPEKDPALDADDPEKDPAAEEETVDADEETPLEDRMDARLLDVVRQFERVTGEKADLKKSVNQLLSAAVKAAGLTVRADASSERMLGALEAWRDGAIHFEHWKSEATKVDAKDAKADLDADAHNRNIAASFAAKSRK